MPPFKKRKEDDESGEWALTMADMMTLLLCFFVVMLSVSSFDKGKYDQVVQSLAAVMSGQPVPGTGAGSGPAKDALYRIGEELLQKLIDRRDVVHFGLRPDAVSIELSSQLLFDLGSARLTEDAASVLAPVADSLRGTPYVLTIEGHTDDIPISTAAFPSNWELSSARASSVARFFEAQGIPRARLRVQGLADTMPVKPNRDDAGKALPENQARNRRVVLLVKPGE